MADYFKDSEPPKLPEGYDPDPDFQYIPLPIVDSSHSLPALRSLSLAPRASPLPLAPPLPGPTASTPAAASRSFPSRSWGPPGCAGRAARR